MIRGVYEWEECAESSTQFQAAATVLEQDFKLENRVAEEAYDYESSAEESESSDDGSYESSFVSKSGSESEAESEPDGDDTEAEEPVAAGEEAWSPGQHGPRPKRRPEDAAAGEPWSPGQPDPSTKRHRGASPGGFASWTPGWYGPDAPSPGRLSTCEADQLSAGAVDAPSPGLSTGLSCEADQLFAGTVAFDAELGGGTQSEPPLTGGECAPPGARSST